MTEPSELLLFSTPSMAAIFSSQAHVRGMLAFEAALARAEARVGIIPQEAATAIAASCKEEPFDVAALYREAALAGSPAIPLVHMLTAHAAQHRQTLMVGRTLLQHAVPITFGLKSARWLALMVRQVQALREHRERTLAVQLGGAAGTLASLGDQGLQVLDLLAEGLGLPAPDLPWHTERDRVAEIAASLGVVNGAVAKMAGDVVLLAQTEVGEVSERTVLGREGHRPCRRNTIPLTRSVQLPRHNQPLGWCR